MNINKKQIIRAFLVIFVRISPIVGAVLGLIIGGIFVLLWNEMPGVYMLELFKGSFGSATKIGATLNRTTPLMLAGLGTAIAWKAGAINIGQEGQLFVGGLGAGVVSFWVADFPPVVALPLSLLGGVVFGMLLASIAALMRLYNGIHEILTTLLLNFIGVLFTSFMVSTVINDPITSGIPQTPVFPESTWMPVWKGLGNTHAGIAIAIILALAGGYMLWFTPLGFKFRMAGFSSKATRAAGYSPNRIFVMGMLISGGLSGLAGAVEVLSSIYHRLQYGFGTGLGFDSLAVALLANTNPFGVLPSSLFFGGLRAGMLSMQRAMGVPAVLLQIVQGSIILFIVIGFAVGNSKTLQKQLRAAELEDLDAAQPVAKTNSKSA